MKKCADAKKLKKSDFLTKICSVCGKPMPWRKRWEKVRAQVKYCSERCRRSKNQKLRSCLKTLEAERNGTPMTRIKRIFTDIHLFDRT